MWNASGGSEDSEGKLRTVQYYTNGRELHHSNIKHTSIAKRNSIEIKCLERKEHEKKEILTGIKEIN